MHTELLDVVNEDDVIIDSKSRNEVHQIGLLHREIHIWLFDKDKNIYFSKTNANKSSAGLLDASIGGHVDKGEEHLVAAIRETEEESGLSINASDLIFLTKFTNTSINNKRINNFFRSVYIYKYPINDEQIKIDIKENDGFEKFSFDFLLHMRKEKEIMFHKFIPTHELPLVLKYLNTHIF